METSAGEPLISIRPYAVTKWLVWLVSKESRCVSGSLPSYTKPATYLTAPPAVLSLQREEKKNTRVTKPLGSQYCGKTKQTCRNVCKWSSGEANGWPMSHHEPQNITDSAAIIKVLALSRCRGPIYVVTLGCVHSSYLRAGFV